MSGQRSSGPIVESQLVLRAVLRTDVGLVRSENQDFGTWTTASEASGSLLGGRLLVVADGMGGHRGGATASRLAAETIKHEYLATHSDDVAQALRSALERANAKVFAEAQANPDLRGMGTTTSALAAQGGMAWLAHVGDSRIYRVRGGEIEQLTQDHSLVATMVREGLLTAEEAETHPRRNVLQRSMGVAEEVDVDIVGPIELQEGDTFILCSDGLHGVVRESELKEIAAAPIDLAADEFVRRALQRGAPDNVTVIVARVEGANGEEDEPLEKTQPMTPVALADDEATKATQKIVAAQAEAGAVPPPRKHPFLRWMFVCVLLLGAAGIWVYCNHATLFPGQSHSRSSR